MTSAPSIYSSFLPSDLLSPVHQVAPLSDHDHSQSQVRRSVWSGRGLAPVSDHLVGYSFFFFSLDGRRAVGPAHSLPLSFSVFFFKPHPQPQPLPDS